MISINCAWCDKEIKRYASQITGYNCCSRECMNKLRSRKHNPQGYKDFVDYTAQSVNMSRINRELNPTRMTPEVREKIRLAHLAKEGLRKSYAKIYGRHEHRIVAEEMIGRPLAKGEIVHHKDGNIRNNDPENLEVMTQAEHINRHREQGDL